MGEDTTSSTMTIKVKEHRENGGCEWWKTVQEREKSVKAERDALRKTNVSYKVIC